MTMQYIDRRSFLKTLGIAGAASLAGIPALALRDAGISHLTILHTNDTHSRLDPYPPNDPNYPGMGGYARRASLINQHQKNDPDLILLDAGDVFQGTPYFNMYGGKPELKLMSKMGYDAVAFGNHEFDNGLEGFKEVLPNAGFPFLAANYDFSQTILAGKVKDYVMLDRGGRRIGIYGLGIDPKGLVSRNLYGDTKYLDPIEKAREMENVLHNKQCDLIICLSHLGFDYNDDKVSDTMVAGHTRHTGIIIGGHTHVMLDPPAVVENQIGNQVFIGQAGYGGTYMGIMSVFLNGRNEQNFVESHTTKI